MSWKTRVLKQMERSEAFCKRKKEETPYGIFDRCPPRAHGKFAQELYRGLVDEFGTVSGDVKPGARGGQKVNKQDQSGKPRQP